LTHQISGQFIVVSSVVVAMPSPNAFFRAGNYAITA
jgi:hypothetical protein